MAEVHRIKVKFGDAEFEAEGAEDKVQAQYDQFLAALARAVPKPNPSTPLPQPGTPEALAINGLLGRLFELRADGVVVLKVRPEAVEPADIVGLLLLGYRKLKSEESVLATQLLKAARLSGFGYERIDRAAEAYMPTFIMRGGSRKGTNYTLTTQGVTKAEEIAAQIIK